MSDKKISGELAGAIGPMSPRYVLEQIATQLDDIESIVVCIKYKEQAWHTTWSSQDVSDMIVAKEFFAFKLTEIIKQNLGIAT